MSVVKTVEVSITPTEMANEFCEWTNYDQAKFLSVVARRFQSFNGANSRSKQLQFIAEASDPFTDEWVMDLKDAIDGVTREGKPASCSVLHTLIAAGWQMAFEYIDGFGPRALPTRFDVVIGRGHDGVQWGYRSESMERIEALAALPAPVDMLRAMAGGP